MDKYLGKRLDGRYEMRELIGVGGMAYVYKAYDVIDDRIVAVKILKDEFLNSDEFVRRFRNESKAIAILNHPNIVKVLDVGFGERLQYIVMEYIDGITLKEYLDQRKDIRWKEAVHFTVQILRALQHAHDKGIVHRDIKPQNIMLLSDGTIKVTDFGIARLTRSDMKATVDGNKAIGSVHYISPEQARGEITDEKTDLYAVGIMLYETLTGRLPFEADNAVSVAIMQMQSEAKAPHLINAEIPEGLEQITLKAMQKDTAKRYQSAAEMLSDFEEFKRNPSIKFEYTYMVDETPTRYVDAITRVRGETTDPSVKGKTETPTRAKRSSGKKNPANKKATKTVSLIVILCLVTALTIGAVVWLVAWLINGGGRKQVDEVEVKNFIGMMYYTEIDGVNEYKESYDLKIVWEDANNPDRKVGEVFKQSPMKGKKVKKGSTVTLYVNNATPKEISLNVKAEIEGVHKDEVQALLQEAGFEVKEDPRSSETIPADHVIKIDIEKGKSYPHGKIVTMTVSTGVSELPNIEFPDFIIGQTIEKAKEILINNKFQADKIKDLYVNYTDEKYAEKGTVMGVMIDNVLLEELPEEISPDADLTLVVSNSCKDVVVELEWPKDIDDKNVDVTLGVTTMVAGTPNSTLAEHYASGKKPSSTTDKMTFTLTEHPSDKPYIFEVSIKKYSASDKKYTEYAEVKIYPADYTDPATNTEHKAGTYELVGDYQYLPGISPGAKIPENMVNQSFTLTEITDKLDGFKTVIVKLDEVILTQDDGRSLTVEQILYNGEIVDGKKIKFGVALAANAEIVVKVKFIPTAIIPKDLLGQSISYSEIVNKLGSFENVTIKQDGKILTQDDGRSLTVEQILYNGTVVDGKKIKFGVELAANVEIVVKVKFIPTAIIPNDLLGQTFTYNEIINKLGSFEKVTVKQNGKILTQDNSRSLTVEQILYNGEIVDGKKIQFGVAVPANVEVVINVKYIPTGIIPNDLLGQTFSYDEIVNKLGSFEKITVKAGESTLTTDDGKELTVDEILYDGQVVDGTDIKFGVSVPANVEITVKVSVISLASIPNLIDRYGTYAEIAAQLSDFETVIIRSDSTTLSPDDEQRLLVESIVYNGNKVGGQKVKFDEPVPTDGEIIVTVSIIDVDVSFPQNIFAQTSRKDIEDLLSQFDNVSIECIACDDEVLESDNLMVVAVVYTTKNGESVTIDTTGTLPESLSKTTTIAVYVDVQVQLPSIGASVDQLANLTLELVYQDKAGNLIEDPSGRIILDITDENGVSVVGTIKLKGDKLTVILDDPQ